MRLKIVAGNLAVVVLLGLAAYFTVSSQVRNLRLNEIDASIDNSRILFDRSYRLSTLEFEARVAERAGARQMRDIFGGLDLDSRRNRAYDAAEATFAWLADPARGRGSPEIVVVVDETGVAIARNGARNVLFGTPLAQAIPALGRALKTGESQHDVWLETEQSKVLQTAVAPIRSDTDTLLGALIVGYDLSNGFAASEAKTLNRDIAFVVDGKVYSSSLDGAAARDLRGALFGNVQAPTTKAILAAPGAASQPWRATLSGADYVGVTARLPLAQSVPIAFAVLGNRTAATQIANVANVILVMLVIGALLVVAYGFAIGTSIMRPIEQIEEGVLQVINGRTDLRLETDSRELGGLAFRINQLLNVFTGTEEASEDEDGKISVPPSEGHWKDAAFADTTRGSSSGSSSNTNNAVAVAAAGGSAEDVVDDAAVAGELSRETEDTYQDRLYREYVQAKQALGENVSNIPKDRFWQRLTGRAEALVQKHGCRMVRFQVHTLDNQVVLRPVLIR